MKQVIIKKGKAISENISAPMVSKGNVLIKVAKSCISTGTELGGIKQTRQSLVKRALKNKDEVQKVIELAKEDGIKNTLNKIKSKVDSGNPTGYSLSGVVIDKGSDVKDIFIGDRVTASGAGIANHAEYVNVPVNLVTKMPDNLGFREASTVTLGAIALQGVRRAELKLGEFAVVFGVGIIGLITVQLLKSAGVRIMAIDYDDNRLNIAKSTGAEIIINPSKVVNPVEEAHTWSNGFGTDAVLFTAATTDSKPLADSFNMCRRKGKVVIVGVVGMDVKREDMYQKELDLLMSTSYGPGRYDKLYEEKGIDYPYGYVRWTENRNMSEYLRMLAFNQIDLKPLFADEYNINDVEIAYKSIEDESKPLIITLDYGSIDDNLLNEYANHERIILENRVIHKGQINVGIIGTGGFAMGVHLPNLKKLNSKYNIYAVANRNGVTAKTVAVQYGAKYSSTDIEKVINDEKINLIIITTPHASHGQLVLKALKANKNVFVEKPLAVSIEELQEIENFYMAIGKNKPLLFVGFNRRFSKYAKAIKEYTKNRTNPLFIRYRMNAGFLPDNHWVHEQGGRIIGEACHIIDLMSYLVEAEIESVFTENIDFSNSKFSSQDNKTFSIKYKDGSVCNIDYFSVGNKLLSKEYMEVHFDGKSIVLDDYKEMRGYGINLKMTSSGSEKGQYEELLTLHDYLIGKSNKPPIELWDLFQTTKTTLII